MTIAGESVKPIIQETGSTFVDSGPGSQHRLSGEKISGKKLKNLPGYQEEEKKKKNRDSARYAIETLDIHDARQKKIG